MRPIRLAFAGASGTGKSTIAKAIAEIYELPMCPVGSREVSKEMGFDSPYDVDAAGKRGEFQQALLRQKRDWEKNRPGGFVTDRTHLDNLAYTTMHAADLGADLLFRGAVAEAMAVYTHIVFCPARSFISGEVDPARMAERGYHARYEIIIWSLLLDQRLPHDMLVLGTPSLEDRIEKVRSFVRT